MASALSFAFTTTDAPLPTALLAFDMREDMPFPTEVVEDSEDEGMLMDLPRRMLTERRAGPGEGAPLTPKSRV